jgi:hypothetical protein
MYEYTTRAVALSRSQPAPNIRNPRVLRVKRAQNGFFLMFTDVTDRKRSAPNVRASVRAGTSVCAAAWLTVYSYFEEKKRLQAYHLQSFWL